MSVADLSSSRSSYRSHWFFASDINESWEGVGLFILDNRFLESSVSTPGATVASAIEPYAIMRRLFIARCQHSVGFTGLSNPVSLCKPQLANEPYALLVVEQMVWRQYWVE